MSSWKKIAFTHPQWYIYKSHSGKVNVFSTISPMLSSGVAMLSTSCVTSFIKCTSRITDNSDTNVFQTEKILCMY